jgi:hypothetical protein
MWKLFQAVIFLSVYFTGIHYEWTPNGYVLGVLSFLAALLATVAVAGAIDLLSRPLKSGRVLFVKKRHDNRLSGRR